MRFLACLIYSLLFFSCGTKQSLTLQKSEPSSFSGPLSQAESKLRQGLPYKVELTRQGFTLDGSYHLLRGGSVQWFRLPEDTWEDRLRRYKSMGFNALDIYIAWNQIEPHEGEFNVSKPALGHFLELAKKYGLFVAVRPGPYITNEMDGGGLPAWLTRYASKTSFDADGKVNLRSDDPDFIEPVRRYLTRLNQFLLPYMADHGGPIVLYTIENEYNWFERSFQADKLFWYEGDFERPHTQKIHTREYFTALRDIVRSTGVTVPLVTCPGDGKASSTGDVPGVIPFPNIYEWANEGQPEEVAYDLLQDMQDPLHHGGVYRNFPGGSMEVNRSPQELRRLLMGGLDSIFVFNIVGMIQQGYTNAVALGARVGDAAPHWGIPGEKPSNWLGAIFSLATWNQILNGFVSPVTGYFGNVMDYDGAISPSGVQRDLAYQYRRDNLFYNMVEEQLGASGIPRRSGSFEGADPLLSISNPLLGVRQKLGMLHYWHSMPNGSNLLGIMNQSGKVQSLPLGSLTFKNRRYPRYVPMTIPLSDEQRMSYNQFMLFDWPLDDNLKLHYTTSEILSVQPYNSEKLLVVYGVEGSAGELNIVGEGLQLLAADPAFTLHKGSDQSLSLSYPHRVGLVASVKNKTGEVLRILVTTRAEAGRIWFLEQDNVNIVLAGIDGVEHLRTFGGTIAFSQVSDQRPRPIFTLSPVPMVVDGWIPQSDFSQRLHITHYNKHARTDRPSFPAIDSGLSKQDVQEADPAYDDSSWKHWTGKPEALELLDIFGGHAWYRASFEIHSAEDIPKFDDLYIQSASDLVGIYVNGAYLATVNPLGTEIDSQSLHAPYHIGSLQPHLRVGRNILAFRTEVWGHGSFMFGRGTLIASRARIPALPYDGLKGLYGIAKIGQQDLTEWAVRSDLGGEKAGYTDHTFHPVDWQQQKGDIRLKKGEIRWFRTEIDSDDMPDPKQFDLSPILVLKGRSSKATIYFNGRILGRWLSDNDWLQKGFWGRPQRGIWVSLNPDHFPLPIESFRRDGSPNILLIAFEDTSVPGADAGFIEAPRLDDNQEDLWWDLDTLRRGPGIRWRDPIQLRPVDTSW